MNIRPLKKEDISALKAFTDVAIGKNYFSIDDLNVAFEQSQSQGVMCSFVLVNESQKLMGIRLALAPGKWTHGKGKFLRPDLWGVEQSQVGYFQSLFISPEAQGQNWGPQLSQASLSAFKLLNAKAVVTHAWKESPNNSSLRYLKKFGFKEVITHPLYWFEVDYECTHDGKPCRCSAIEMIKLIN